MRLIDEDFEFRNWSLCRVNSICNNLSRPGVTCLNNHTYVSVKQCIAYYLGKGNVPQKYSLRVNSNTTFFLIHSEYCQEARDRAFRNNRNVPKEYVLIPIVGIWSDDLIQIASV